MCVVLTFDMLTTRFISPHEFNCLLQYPAAIGIKPHHLFVIASRPVWELLKQCHGIDSQLTAGL